MVLVVLGYNGKKLFKKIICTWCYHECKGPVLVIRIEETAKVLFLLARVCQQVICKVKELGICIQLVFCIERSLVWRLIIFCNL